MATKHDEGPTEYETWVSIRSEFAFLFEDIAQGPAVGFPRDFSNIFTRRYHEYLDRDDLATGTLVMILCMTLWDINKHQDSYPLIHDPECHAAIKKFRSQKRSVMRLAETVLIAMEIILETDFHSRDTHRQHGQLMSVLPWVREHIILEHFRQLASGRDAYPD